MSVEITDEAVETVRRIIDRLDSMYAHDATTLLPDNTLASDEDQLKLLYQMHQLAAGRWRQFAYALWTAMSVGEKITWDSDTSLYFSGGQYDGGVILHDDGEVRVHS